MGTGNTKSESGIYRINIVSREIEILDEGEQKYRACSIIQKEKYLFFGSDAPDDDNYKCI